MANQETRNPRNERFVDFPGFMASRLTRNFGVGRSAVAALRRDKWALATLKLSA
jgi:hypothetical protein